MCSYFFGYDCSFVCKKYLTVALLKRECYAGVKYIVKTQECHKQMSGDCLAEVTVKAVLTVLVWFGLVGWFLNILVNY